MFEGFEVLYVEDDPQVRASLVQTMELAGIAVLAHESAEAVLPALAAADKAVLVTDMRLPGMDGLSLLQQAFAEHQTVGPHAELEVAQQVRRRIAAIGQQAPQQNTVHREGHGAAAVEQAQAVDVVKTAEDVQAHALVPVERLHDLHAGGADRRDRRLAAQVFESVRTGRSRRDISRLDATR